MIVSESRAVDTRPAFNTEDRLMSFQNKTIVITGGASGIGLLCGRCYAREGANVLLIDIDREKLKAAVEDIAASGGIAAGVRGDVRCYPDVKRACDAAVSRFGSIDILLNCAGGASTRVFQCDMEYHEYPLEYIDWGIDVNLKGPMYFSREAMKQMVRQRSGVIVLLGSIAGEEGNARSVDYSAAKSALTHGFLKSLAQCGAPYNIRVCAVSPGPVLTRPEMAQMQTLMGRAAEAQEIADFILFITSDKASFVTGANFMIDGGRSCMSV